MLIEKIYDYKRSQIKQYPTHTNRASELGHECLRYLVFVRTHWQERSLPELDLQLIFDEGRIHEAAVLRDLQDAGFNVIEQQRSFEWKKYEITGHIDAKVVLSETAVLPVEIKSCSQFVFDKVNSLDDLFKSKYPHLRRYPAQLTLYCLMDAKEGGLFIFKNKQNGKLKEIALELDYDFAEELIKKAETINEHVKNGTVPDPIEWTEESCGGCGFRHICGNEAKRDAIDFSDDADLKSKLERREELIPFKVEFAELDEEVKAKLKGKDRVVVGDFLITGKEIKKQMPAKEASIQMYWQTKISKL